MSSSAPLIEVGHLSVRYGARLALQDVSLEIRPGEFVALAGPNGAGKTTFVRAVLGLVPVSEGEVRVRGTPLSGLSYRDRARAMAWLPQEEQPQDNVPILDYVLFGRYAHIPPFYSEDSADFARAEEALRSVDLWDRRDSGIWEVSGGERQRVLLARALAQDAPILLLDEPTSHLDVAHQLEMLDRMERWRREAGRAVVAAMHDLNLAARYADRIVVLSHGRRVEDGRPEAVLSTPLLRTVWGIDAELRRDASTGLPYLIPTLSSRLGERPAPSSRLRGPVHVVGGGGAASASLRALVEDGFVVTTGVLALFDTDSDTARELEVPTVLEVPFVELSEKARAENRALLAASAAIVVAPFAVGASNLGNLEDVRAIAGSRPTFLLDAASMERRDFTGGRAVALRDELVASHAEDVGSVPELLERLRSALDGMAAPSGAEPSKGGARPSGEI
jgi:iron complex transport system ATP-binding protein